MKNCFLTASTKYYKDNSFDELLKHTKENDGYIYWLISYDTNNGIRTRHIEKGDMCYVYYSNLPDLSSRVLFYGKVYESDYPNNIYTDKSIYNKALKDEKYIKLKLRSICLDKDKDKFSLTNLINKYSFPKRLSYFVLNEKKYKKFIDDINEYACNGNGSLLKGVNDYFNENYCICEFEKYLTERNHKTFIERNGFYFINKHHLVVRSQIKNYKDDSDIVSAINDERNLFRLCPTCHMELHYGKKDRVREMINILYNKDRKFYDNKFKKVIGNNKDVLDWLYEIYNVK